MRREMMELLACPQCKDELELQVEEEGGPEAEVLRGTLLCVTCGRAYRIDDGIPDLRPPEDQDEGQGSDLSDEYGP